MIQNLTAPTGVSCESRAVRVRRRGRPSKLVALTRDLPELYADMLDLIRLGAFVQVAAQFIGVAPDTFSRWMSKGGRQRRGIYRQFRQDVLQATAEARVSAEIRVYREAPLSWLRFGPGRTTPIRPGWTDLRHTSNVETTVDAVPPPRVSFPVQADLGATLKLLEQLGQIAILPMGHAMFDAPQGDGVDT